MPHFRWTSATNVAYAIALIILNMVDAGKFVAIELASTPISCDVNHDGTPNGLDVQAFTNLMLLGGADWTDVCSGDLEITPDGVLDYDDVDPFVTCLLTQP